VIRPRFDRATPSPQAAPVAPAAQPASNTGTDDDDWQTF
jgi:hypothetical protein